MQSEKKGKNAILYQALAVLAFGMMLLIIVLSILFAINSIDYAHMMEPVITSMPREDYSFTVVINNYAELTRSVIETKNTALIILSLSLFSALILLGLQFYFWAKDRRRLVKWKKAGFLCQSLEFLPANRVKINNVELAINKTQISTLKMLAQQREKGKPLHSLEMDHGVQTIKRLREELGARLLESTFVKVRKGEGYWLEVNPKNIYYRGQGSE